MFYDELPIFKSTLDFLGYIVRPNYMLVRQRVVNHFKYKKAKFYEYYESEGGDKVLQPILQYNQAVASFHAHIKHANSHKLKTTVGAV